MFKSSRTILRTSLLARSLNPVQYRFKSTPPGDLPSAQTHSVQEGFAQHPVFVFNVAKRFVKFSLVGVLLIGGTTGALFETAHAWVENVELAISEEEDEIRRFEWHLDREKWSGDTQIGGTDPALGFKGRHLVRAAWMAQHWGVDQQTAVIGSDAVLGSSGLSGPRGLVIIDPRLVRAEDFLRNALSVAEKKKVNGKLRPWTMTHLLFLHAGVLERMGPESSLVARSQYERAWASQPAMTIESARIAMKLGDLNHRLGDGDSAVAWWDRAIHLAGDGPSAQNGEVNFAAIPKSLPVSPCAQRILFATLTSLSAFYAMTGRLREAQSVDEQSLDLLRAVRQPQSLSSVTPAHALHALTLLQRSSVFSVHLAEVLYAEQGRSSTSIQWLASAAECSERVSKALTGIPLSSSANPDSDRLLFSATSRSVLPSYLDSASMKKPASSLFRDACRTAAESWSLMGLLSERKDAKAALGYFERAVSLAGDPNAPGNPADETLVADWEMIWKNYRRLKAA